MSLSSRTAGFSISTKLNLVLALSVLVVLGGAGAYLSYWLGQKSEARSMVEMDRSNLQVVDMVEAYASVLEHSAESLGAQFSADLPKPLTIDSTEHMVSGKSELPVLRGGDQVLNNNFVLVDSYASNAHAIATVFIRHGDDFFRVATSLKKEDGERAVGTALGNKHPAFAAMMAGTPFTGRAKLFGRDYMARYLPLKDAAGQVIGLTFIGIDFTEGLAALEQKINVIKFGETGLTSVIDTGLEPGRVLIHRALKGKNILDARDVNGRAFIKEMIDLKNGTLRHGMLQQSGNSSAERISVVHSFDKWNWLITSTVDVDELMRDAHELRVRFVQIGLLVIVVLIVVVYTSSRRWVSQPLAEAVALTRRVAGGDLSVNIRVESRDEVGNLLEATNQMCEQLRTIIGYVNESIDKLDEDAGNLVSVSEQLSENSGAQSEAATAVSAAIEQLTASVDRVSGFALEAKETAEQSETVSDNGATVIESATNEMVSIADTVRQASATVSRLGTQSEEIATVVNVIRGIADQTNLLALNAAIEAARAGEQGRGFAVVADEVRQLAERTTQSTQEIAEMIERIQADANAAVTDMKAGVEQVDIGVELAGKAGTSIRDIKQGSSRVGEAVNGIADALREQTASSHDIAQNMENIAQQVERNHGQTMQTSEAAANIKKLIVVLRKNIAHFRL